MINFNLWTNENTLTLVTIIFAFCAGIFALYQWRKLLKLQRAQFVRQLIEKLRFDREVYEAAYLIDYGQDWYNENFYMQEDRSTEARIDKYLAYLSYLCYLISTKILTEDEILLFEYKLVRTIQSYSVQAYLWNLTHFSKRNNTRYSCDNLVKYGINKKIIDNDFLTNKNKYPKYLNF